MPQNDPSTIPHAMMVLKIRHLLRFHSLKNQKSTSNMHIIAKPPNVFRAEEQKQTYSSYETLALNMVK
jgi:hypothetical protein